MPVMPKKKICQQHTGVGNGKVMVVSCGQITWLYTGDKGPLAISRSVLSFEQVASKKKNKSSFRRARTETWGHGVEDEPLSFYCLLAANSPFSPVLSKCTWSCVSRGRRRPCKRKRFLQHLLFPQCYIPRAAPARCCSAVDSSQQLPWAPAPTPKLQKAALWNAFGVWHATSLWIAFPQHPRAKVIKCFPIKHQKEYFRLYQPLGPTLFNSFCCSAK